jgi:hypothetical protein
MNKKKILKWLIILTLIASIYPAFVVGVTWSFVVKSDLQGGKNGPLDAYRHTLASALVSYTTGDFAVRLFTDLVESKHKNSGIMDRHNNLIGASIGSKCKSFSEIEPAVKQAVLNGSIESKQKSQVTWLPEEEWHKGRFW